MGQKLNQYYTLIAKLQSMKGKMDLAMKTRYPSTKVALEEDSPELLAAFEKAFHEITGMSSAEAEKKVKLMEGK
jgi:hypothetical protein